MSSRMYLQVDATINATVTIAMATNRTLCPMRAIVPTMMHLLFICIAVTTVMRHAFNECDYEAHGRFFNDLQCDLHLIFVN